MISVAAVFAVLVQLAGPVVASADDGSGSNGRRSNFGTTIGDLLHGLFNGSPFSLPGGSGNSGNDADENDGDPGENQSSRSNRRTVVEDKFRDDTGTSLPDHEPDIDAVGGGWVQDLFSDFQIAGHSGTAMEVTDLGPTQIATVDTLLPQYELSVEITRDVQANETGVVLRFVDSDNYFAVIFDGFWLKLVRVVDGDEDLLRRRPVPLWRNGDTRTLHVALAGEDFTVSLNGREYLSGHDPELAGATRAGLYYSSNVESRFKAFKVDALAAAPGPAPVPAPNPAAVVDAFTAPDGTSLDSHAPDLVASTGWQEIVGDWSITGGAATLAVPFADADQFAVIPTGVSDQTMSADITYNGGLAGLVWDRDDAVNFRFVFFDGSQLVLARVESGNFIEHGRTALDWQPGETRNITVRINGTSVRIYLDGSDIIIRRGIDVTQGASDNAGLFTRFTTANRFDNFDVRPSVPLAQPDPGIPPGIPYVPSPATVPGDAWLYDSFNDYNLTWLQFRDPELDPSGDGWLIDSGKWYTWDGAASENSRVYDPLSVDRHAMIDTGRDQYELTVDVTWDGDRIGVLFGGRASGPEDLGQNQYGVWKNGDGEMILYRWVGGVPYTVGGEWAEPEEVNWKEGQTRQLKVRVDGTRARIYVGGHEIFDFVDSGLEYGTWVGLFQRGKHDERFDNFQVSLLPGQEPPDNLPVLGLIPDQAMIETETLNVPVAASDVDDDPIALSLGSGSPSFASIVDNGDGTGFIVLEPVLGDFGTYTVEVTATTDGGSVSTTFGVNVDELTLPVSVVLDTFTDADGIELPSHSPEIAPVGSVWIEASTFGDWVIDGNRAVETTLIDWADHRLVIETGQPDGSAFADIEFNGGNAGLTVRYIDETQMVLAWVEQGSPSPQVVLGYIVPGSFIELGRVSLADLGMTWNAGETRTLAVVMDGESITVMVDGVEAIAGTLALYTTASKAGLLTRSSVQNYFDTFNYTVQVPASNQPPVFTPVTDQIVDENATLSVAVSAIDPEGDPIILQPGAGFPTFGALADNGDGSGSVEFAPDFDDAGTYPIELVALTLAGSTTLTFDLTVNDTLFAAPEATMGWWTPCFEVAGECAPGSPDGAPGTEFTFTADVTADGGIDRVEWDFDGDSAVDATTPLAGETAAAGVTITFTYGESGIWQPQVRAVDETGQAGAWDAYDIFGVPVDLDVDQPPVLDPVAGQSVDEDATLSVPIFAFDADGDPITLQPGTGFPLFATLNDSGDGTGSIDFSPGFDDAGVYPIEIVALTLTGSAAVSFSLTVNNTDRLPSIDSILDAAVEEGGSLPVSISSYDADGDAITLSLGLGAPVFASLVDNGDGTGVIDLEPLAGDAGTYTVEVIAATSGGSNSTTFDVTVDALVGATFIFDSFTGPDGSAVPPHSPDQAPAGSSWTEVSAWGDWLISGNRVSETTLIDWADHRLVIDSGESDATASVDIEYSSLNAGLTFRYVDELNWVMAWFVINAGTEQVVLAYLDNGVYFEFERANLADLGMSWALGETHELSVRYVGDDLKVYVDGAVAIHETLAVHQAATHVGLFTRGATSNYFDNFAVVGPLAEVDLPPEIDPIGNQEVSEEATLNIPVSASDPDGDAIALALAPGAPAFVALVDNGDGTGLVTTNPGATDAGIYTVEVVATGSGGSDATTFQLTVTNLDTLPSIGPIEDQAMSEGDSLAVAVGATDPDGDPISLSLGAGSPAFATLIDNGDGTGEITLAPLAGDAGSYPIEVIAATAGGAVSVTFNVLVSAAPAGVQVILDTFTNADNTTIPPHAPDVAPVGSVWSEASTWGDWDIDGNRATEFGLIPWADHRVVIESGEPDATASVDIEYSSGNAGLAFRYIDESNWIMAWCVSDGVNAQAVLAYLESGSFVEVDRVNLSDFGLSWATGETHELSVSYVGDDIKVFVDGNMVIDKTVAVLQAATYVGLFARSDTSNYFDNFKVEIPGGPGNDAPALAGISTQFVDEGTASGVALSATDNEGDPITLTLEPGAPAFVALTDNGDGTGSVVVTPGFDAAGTYTVSVTASATGGSSTQTFDIIVNNVDRVPAVDPIADQSMNEGEAINVPVSASDLDGDAITLSLGPGAPAFALLADNGDGTGSIALSPQPGDAGSHPIEVIATANSVGVSTSFNVLVSAPPSGGVVVSDTFTDSDGSNVPPHAADVAPSGAEWVEVSAFGDWTISGNRVTESTHIDWADHRVVIDSGESGGAISVDLEYNGGSAGIVFRYVDEDHMLLAWFHHTPGGQQAVLGYISPGNFTELARVNISDFGLTWDVGEIRNFAVEMSGDTVAVKIEGVEVISETASVYQAATISGLFARSSVDNFFDNFEVTAP